MGFTSVYHQSIIELDRLLLIHISKYQLRKSIGNKYGCNENFICLTFDTIRSVSMWIIFITNKDHTKLHPYYILLVIGISCLFLLLDGNIPDIYCDTNFHRTNNSKCNCVVFRMDDIQDYWLNSVQSAVMDLFLSKGQNLSLGLITHAVGNDSKIVDNLLTVVFYRFHQVMTLPIV
jgi:hypothetical protein